MNDAGFVRSSEACAQLLCDLQRFVRWQPPDSAHQRRQIFAIHKLHGQERVFASLATVSDITDLSNIKDAADVRMRDLPRQTYFTRETLQRLFCLRQRPWQKFQRHRLAEF